MHFNKIVYIFAKNNKDTLLIITVMKTLTRAALVLALLSIGVCASAQTSELYVNEFALVKGETKTVNIYLNNPDYTPTALQFDLKLTGGLKLVMEEGDMYPMIYPCEERIPCSARDGFNSTGNWMDNHSYFRYLCFNSKGKPIIGTSGAVLTLTLMADETYGTTSEKATVSLSNVRLSSMANTSSSYKAEGLTTSVFQPISSKDFFSRDNENKTCFYADPLEIVAVCRTASGSALAFATDGDNWIKLDFPNGTNLMEGATYEGGSIGGIATGLATNPTLTINSDSDTDYPEALTFIDKKPVNYTDIEQPMEFKPNEVVSFTGHFFMDNGTPSISRWSGQNGARGVILPLNTSWCGAISFSEQQYQDIKVAVQLKDTKNAPRRLQDDRNTYSAYEFFLLDASSAIVTAIDDITTASGVTSVKYYNLAGLESTAPHAGVNIVVTTHADGSKTTSKSIF